MQFLKALRISGGGCNAPVEGFKHLLGLPREGGSAGFQIPKAFRCLQKSGVQFSHLASGGLKVR